MHNNGQNTGSFEYADLNYLLVLLRESAVLLSTKIGGFKHKEPVVYAKYNDFIDNLEALIKTVDTFHNSSDEKIALMTPEQRKILEREATGFFSILGWRNKIDDEGRIIHDA